MANLGVCPLVRDDLSIGKNSLQLGCVTCQSSQQMNKRTQVSIQLGFNFIVKFLQLQTFFLPPTQV